LKDILEFSNTSTESSQKGNKKMKAVSVTRAFAHPLCVGSCGIIIPLDHHDNNEICWSVSTEEQNEVTIWQTKRGSLQTDEWKGRRHEQENSNIISCGLIVRDENVKQRKRAQHVEAQDDGFILASGSSLYWRFPSSITSYGVSFDLFDLDYLKEDETITTIIGQIDSKTRNSSCWIGTSLGRILKLNLNFEASIPQCDELLNLENNNSGLIARFFTPRKAKSKRNHIVSIVRKKQQPNLAFAISKYGDCLMFDTSGEQNEVRSVLRENGDRVVSVIEDNTSFLLQILVQKEGDESVFSVLEEVEGREVLEFKRRYSVAVEHPLGSIVGMFKRPIPDTDLVFVAAQKQMSENDNFLVFFDSKSEVEARLENLPRNDPIVAFAQVNHDVMVLLKSGKAASTKKMAKSTYTSEGKSIPPDRIERLVRSILLDAVELMANLDRKSNFSLSWSDIARQRERVEKILPTLRVKDEWAEIESGNEEAKRVASRKLYELVHTRVCRQQSSSSESKLGEKLDLIHLALFGIDHGLGLSAAFRKHYDRQQKLQRTTKTKKGENSATIAEESVSTADILEQVQTLAEELYGAIECISHELYFPHENEDSLLSNLDKIRTRITGAPIPTTSFEFERSLGIIDHTLNGAEICAKIALESNNRDDQIDPTLVPASNLGKLLRSQVVALLMACAKFYETHTAPKHVTELIRRVQSLSLHAFQAEQESDAFAPLLRIAERCGKQNKALADVALIAVKKLAEENLEFSTMIEACYRCDPEDTHTIERGLKRSVSIENDEENITPWQDFPFEVFSWLIREKKTLKAFELIGSVFANENDAKLKAKGISQMNSVLVSTCEKQPDLAWLASLHNKDFQTASSKLLSVKSSISPSLGILCAFVNGADVNRPTHLMKSHLWEKIKDTSTRGARDATELMELLETGLILATDSKEKDYVWTHALVSDIAIWKACSSANRSHLGLDFSSTMFVQLSRLIRQKWRRDDLLPGRDFFANLEDHLQDRVAKRDEYSNGKFLQSDLQTLSKTLEVWILK
jgi:hypothetical protein